MRVVNLKEMKDIENRAINDYRFSESLIIENVGINAANFFQDYFAETYIGEEIIFFIGPGNNGADGLSMARQLQNRGHRTRAFLFSSDSIKSQELNDQIELAQKYHVKISHIANLEEVRSYFIQSQEKLYVIDALLGIGFRPPLSNQLFEVVELINSFSHMTISLDIASGVSADNGAIEGNAVMADLTLAIGLPKIGHFTSDGAAHSGQVSCLEAGFPNELLEGGDKRLLMNSSNLSIKSKRDIFAHKNNFGHTLVVGGSQGLVGATLMASQAALKVGAGLVTASTWEESYEELTTRLIPEIMSGKIPIFSEKSELEEIARFLERFDSILIGPGLGRREETRRLVLSLLNNFAGPVVIDADAIHMLSFQKDQEVFLKRKAPTILTPHIGEFANFVGIDKEEVLKKPIDYLKNIVDATHCCWVLKDACSYLGLPNGKTYINYVPNDGMATGGTGDVLAGILAGLLAQESDQKQENSLFSNPERIYEALCLGLIIHSEAGKFAAQKLGGRSMTAGSIIDHLPEAFNSLQG